MQNELESCHKCRLSRHYTGEVPNLRTSVALGHFRQKQVLTVPPAETPPGGKRHVSGRLSCATPGERSRFVKPYLEPIAGPLSGTEQRIDLL